MTPKSTQNKARAKRIAEAFKRKNPGKTPLKVIAIWNRKEETKS